MKKKFIAIALIAATGLTNLATAQSNQIVKGCTILGDIKGIPNPHRKLIPPTQTPDQTIEYRQGSSHQTGNYSSSSTNTSNSQQNSNRSGNTNQNSGRTNRNNKNNTHR